MATASPNSTRRSARRFRPRPNCRRRKTRSETQLVLGEDEDGTELDLSKPLRIAIIGRPNAGKSTLLNTIIGQDRLLTGPEPGLTRDTIGIDFEWRDRKIKMFDTAGLRRRAKVEDKLEKLAGHDALRAAKFAEVVVLLLDATIPFEKQDLTLADLVEREGRALVIGLNKWDLIENKGAKLAELREEALRLLPQVKGAPVVPLSGATGEGVENLMHSIFRVHEVWNKRISTARLNRWLAGRAGEEPAAGRLRAPHQNPLHHAAARAAALFHPVRQSARRIAGEL